MLHSGQQADVGNLVRVLVSNGPTSAFSFGIVDTLEQGFVSADMQTLIVKDSCDEEDYDQMLDPSSYL